MNRKIPMHTQVYEALAARIHSGQWQQGQRVPTEKQLTEEFNISRGPVRQALARLRAEGLLVGGRGAPARVQKTVPAQSFDTYMSFTEWAAELGFTPNQKTIEVTRKLPDPQTAQDLQIQTGTSIVNIVRLRLFGDDPIMLERGRYPISCGQHLLDADLDTESIYHVLRQHGYDPTFARNVIDAIGADELDAQWFGIPVGSPLLRVRRSTYDQRGEPIEVVENRYLPNKASIAIENQRDVRMPVSRLPA